jgi:hypothetical protein
MIDWRWELNTPFGEEEGLYWDPCPQERVDWIFVSPSSSSEIIGHRVINVAQERDPISCQLYKLVYGRLP